MLEARTLSPHLLKMDEIPVMLLPDLAPVDPGPQIAALARRHRRANSPFMTLVNKIGGQIEDQVAKLPTAVRDRVEGLTEQALRQALGAATYGRHAPDMCRRAAPALAALTGALGGAGGLATSLAELPVTVTVILHSILRAAEAEGFDTSLPEVRAEALRVLSSGGPLAEDDGVNTSFLGARLTVTGPALHKLLAKVVPGFAAVLGQKLAAQSVPLLGAVSGAALNAAFLTYYREAAHIRFGLLRLSLIHGVVPVRERFAAELEAQKLNKI